MRLITINTLLEVWVVRVDKGEYQDWHTQSMATTYAAIYIAHELLVD